MENTENTAAEAKTEKAENVEVLEAEASEEQEQQAEELQDSEESSEESSVNEAEEFKEKYYYLAAEMQNMQKRFDREKQNLIKFGNEKILNDMLEVVDNLERTLGFIESDEDEKVKNIVVGIEMIQKMFIETLEKHGLKQIECVGKEFDPNFHEALAQQPAEGKKNMEIILVHQNGYTLNDRVIRAAKVVVAKND